MSDANEWATFEFQDGEKCPHRNVVRIHLYLDGVERGISLDSIRDFLRWCDAKDNGAKIENKDPWKHRSCGMKCRTCMWFVLKELTKFQGRDIDDEGQIAQKNGLGRCRRHAPTMNGYPVCYEDDWCGDHKVDENKVQP